MLFDVRDNALDARDECSFAALMELYEINYIFVRRLVPDVDRSDDRVVSSVAGTPDLHLSITERCPYTTSLRLTHRFEQGSGAELAPDLRVRVYHDARVAEVLPESRPEGFPHWPTAAGIRGGTLAWRWEANRFLNRWLRYCLGEGHAFRPDPEADGSRRPAARRWSG